MATLDSAPPITRVHVRAARTGPGPAGTSTAMVSPRHTTPPGRSNRIRAPPSAFALTGGEPNVTHFDITSRNSRCV
ncbi:hypothetical protein GCM10018963_42210 [Saccharothrix longispora]